MPERDTPNDLADWQQRVAGRSLRTAAARSVERGMGLIRAAVTVLDRANGGEITVQEVADEAAAAGRVQVADPAAASYIVLSLNGAYITAETLGNDVGAVRPDVEGITSFCLHGLRAELADGWFDAVNARLRLPQRHH